VAALTLWFDSLRKSQQDAATRIRNLDKLKQGLDDLKRRLQAPKTRFRTRPKVEEALKKLLAASKASNLVRVEIQEQETETFRQASRGRPTKNTQYVRRVVTRYRLAVKPNADAVIKSFEPLHVLHTQQDQRAYARFVKLWAERSLLVGSSTAGQFERVLTGL